MIKTLSPVQNKDREVFMDVLRGFAIFGILIANVTAGGLGWGPYKVTSGPYLLPELDKKLSFIVAMFIEGKFYSIFSLLFGWGIALQLNKAFKNNINALPTIKRRLLFMVLLGLVHILIWPGDIVLFYAILGFILLPFRKFSNKTLLITGALLILMPIVLYTAKMHWPWVNTPSNMLFQLGSKVDNQILNLGNTEYNEWIKKASWWDVIKSNVGGIFYRYGSLFFISRIPKVFGMFLIGFALGRSNFYKNFAQNKIIVYWIIGLGLIIGLPTNYFLAHYLSNSSNDYYSLKTNGLYQTIAYSFGVAPLALAYVGIFMLCFQKAIVSKIMSVFAPVGKMAFSNYMMHSIFCQFVFLPMGLGLGSYIGSVYLTIFCIWLFACQVIGSTIWLKYFNYGPVEWVWRSLTYWKLQPMKR